MTLRSSYLYRPIVSNTMAARPHPPTIPDTAVELAAHVGQHPEEWLSYLRNIDRYAAALEGENATLYTTIKSLRTEITKGDAIISYQKEQLNERDTRHVEAAERIGRLEAEKA